MVFQPHCGSELRYIPLVPMDPATLELLEGDIPVAVDLVPPSSAVDDVTMDDIPMEVSVASLPASDHEVEEREILDEAMDFLDSQVAVPTTLETTTVDVLIEDIPVAVVQAPPTSAVAEVTMGENLVDVGGASEPTYDHEMGKGQIIHHTKNQAHNPILIWGFRGAIPR
ncbi:hypothetical protein R1sor_023567 [Riccia sorocarpa]|uniref:Uncharacterized protein n=1 Tax=Riccia sorocarpa TaxID=122646 RepID=A0ABD3GPU8_9MARC